MAYALGLLQMAVFTSQTVGPVVGGLMAAAFGFRLTFALGGLMYIISFVLICLVFVRRSSSVLTRATRTSYIANLRDVMRVPAMLLLITIMFLVSSAAVFVRPVIPLVVESFTDTAVDDEVGPRVRSDRRDERRSLPLASGASPSASATSAR